jgi:hypothetical protein
MQWSDSSFVGLLFHGGGKFSPFMFFLLLTERILATADYFHTF